MLISYLYLERDVYGEQFINEVRNSDRDNVLKHLDNKDLIDIGQAICIEIDIWEDMNKSNKDIARYINSLISKSHNINVQSSDSIITFIRYQSISQLCPEKFQKLSKLILELSAND